jgi:hypothetical protein
MLPKITDYLDSQTDAIQRFAAKLGESTHPKEDDLAAIREGDWKRAHESAQRDEGMRGRGFTPTFTARRAIRATQRIGMVGQASPFVGSRSMRTGSASWEFCYLRCNFDLLQECTPSKTAEDDS